MSSNKKPRLLRNEYMPDEVTDNILQSAKMLRHHVAYLSQAAKEAPRIIKDKAIPIFKNPLRERTAQMLPDTAREFDGYSWHDGSRLCTIKKRKVTYMHPLGGPFLGKFQEIVTNPEFIKLPNDREVELKKIGKGHATTAYMGTDKWVYLITSEVSGDKAKSILSDFEGSDQAMKHIPYVENVGYIRKRGGAEFDVYRMPFYRRIGPRDKAVQAQLKAVSLAYFMACNAAGAKRSLRDQLSHAPFFAEYLEAESPGTKEIRQDVKEALIELCHHLEDYEGGWRFEFPSKNVAVDDNGEIVFLDIFFNLEALNNMRSRGLIRR